MTHILNSINRITDAVGRALSWLTVAMVATVLIVVITRYFLQIGSIALQESVTYLHASVFLLGIAYTLKQGGHVRVDIFYRNASSEYKKAVNTFGIIFFLLPMIGVLGYYATDFVSASWSVQEISTEPGGLKIVYIQKSFILLFPLVLGLAGARELYRLWK